MYEDRFCVLYSEIVIMHVLFCLLLILTFCTSFRLLNPIS